MRDGQLLLSRLQLPEFEQVLNYDVELREVHAVKEAELVH
jgi:hypothetical protein